MPEKEKAADVEGGKKLRESAGLRRRYGSSGEEEEGMTIEGFWKRKREKSVQKFLN